MHNHYRKDAGDRGEQQALIYLQEQGLSLQLRNYRCTAGEIDLIMLQQQTLVLIEVRYRRDQEYGGAAASVTITKQQKIIRAAQHLLQTQPKYRRYPVRFDLIAIDGKDGNNTEPRINWIKDAFRL